MEGFAAVFDFLINSPFEGIFFIAAILFASICSIRVKTTFSSYSRVMTQDGLQAHVAARNILDMNGLYNVQITRCSGNLTDHYDPRSKTLALSDSVFSSSSVAAVGVAAHECGHAIQDAKAYGPLRFRQMLAPAVTICSRSWMIVLLIGCFLSSIMFVHIAIIFLAAVVLFQLVTLPVELDASRRALNTLSGNNMLVGKELKGAKKVLSAAAMTYVAGLLTALAQLLRVIASINRKR